MRFLVEVRIPIEAGNAGLKDGTLLQQLQNYLHEVKPEAVYFTVHGQRTVYLVVNIESADKMPEIAEPLWLDWKADVYVTPVMGAEDFEKAGAGIQRVLQARQ